MKKMISLMVFFLYANNLYAIDQYIFGECIDNYARSDCGGTQLYQCCNDLNEFKSYIDAGNWRGSSDYYDWYFAGKWENEYAWASDWIEDDLPQSHWHYNDGHDFYFGDAYQMSIFVGHGSCGDPNTWRMLFAYVPSNEYDQCTITVGRYNNPGTGANQDTGDLVMGEYMSGEYGADGVNNILIMDACCSIGLNKIAEVWAKWDGGGSYGNTIVLGFDEASLDAKYLKKYAQKVKAGKPDCTAWIEAAYEVDPDSDPVGLAHSDTQAHVITVRDYFNSLHAHYPQYERTNWYGWVAYDNN